MQKQETDFFAIFNVLLEHQVEFIIVGGVSAVLQGAPLTTFDLDLVHQRTEENVDRLLRGLGELGAHYRVKRELRLEPVKSALLGPGHHLLLTDVGYLDLLGTLGNGQGYDELLESCEEIELDGQVMRVQGLESLIQIKQHLNRDKDRASLRVLQRLLEEGE